jgi:hypothetical protein
MGFWERNHGFRNSRQRARGLPMFPCKINYIWLYLFLLSDHQNVSHPVNISGYIPIAWMQISWGRVFSARLREIDRCLVPNGIGYIPKSGSMRKMCGFPECLRQFAINRDQFSSNILNSKVGSVVIWGPGYLSLMSYLFFPDFFPLQKNGGANTSPLWGDPGYINSEMFQSIPITSDHARCWQSPRPHNSSIRWDLTSGLCIEIMQIIVRSIPWRFSGVNSVRSRRWRSPDKQVGNFDQQPREISSGSED